MIKTRNAAAALFVAIAAPLVLVSGDPTSGNHGAGCAGCDASAGVRQLTWQDPCAGGGGSPCPSWQAGGGINVVPGTKTACGGACELNDTVCVPKASDPCHAEQPATIQNMAAFSRGSQGASGCQTWSYLENNGYDDLLAKSTTCNGSEDQDIFYAYKSSSCGQTLGDEKVVAWAKCDNCRADDGD